jgi:Ca2+-binding EF-hand superfamily protein
MGDTSFASKLKDALKRPFELLADAKSGCISKKSALAHLLLCKAKQVSIARDDEQIKMLVDLIFEEADLNEDGKISLDEAWEAVSRLASKDFPADIEVTSKEEQMSLLRTIEDYTQQLSLDSKTSGADRLKQLRELAQLVFDGLDTDKSGFLEKEEVIQAFLHFAKKKLHMTGMNPPESIGGALIRLADKDGDGKISIDEFFRVALKHVIVVHSTRSAKEIQDSGLFFDLPSFFDAEKFKSSPMEMMQETDLDDATAEAWLGVMPVVLFTQFKLVLEGYGRDVRGLDAPTADKAGLLEELIRSLPFSSTAVMEATLATLAREGMSLAALASTTDEEFDEIGVPLDAREVIRIGLLGSLVTDQ